MKLLITGANGQLGKELQRLLCGEKSALGALPEKLSGAKVTAIDIDTLDITDLEQTRAFIKQGGFDAVINCAAKTNVDGCETDADGALRANALGPRNLAVAASEIGASLVHVSTDYVFSGDRSEKSGPYGEWDQCDPATVYGKSKWLGEQYVKAICPRFFIVRTAWLYGKEGNNFVKTICRVAREKGTVSVVNDQRGNPTNAEDLAFHLLQLVCSEEYGIYHCTGNGVCSWYDFACEIIKLAGIECEVLPCTTQEYPSKTPRPAFSSLSHAMLRATIGDRMRPWKEALADYFDTI